MTEAYDTKGLVEIAKAKGMDLAEDGAIVVYEAVYTWLLESAVLSPNKYDDMLMIVLPAMDKHIREQLDKVDGKVG